MHSPHSFEAMKDVWLDGWQCLFDGVNFCITFTKITEEESFATIASDQLLSLLTMNPFTII